MLIIPAIDLKDGYVVRYVQGRIDKKIYSSDPLKTARHWVKNGAEMLHLVDLDGAFSGVQKNLDIVKEIASKIKVPLEFGGGVRKMDTVRMLLGFGVQRVVLGTRAAEDKTFLKRVIEKFKSKVIVSIDAREKAVLTKGWRQSFKGIDALGFALLLKKIGFKQCIYTDITKDGTLLGPNIKGIKDLLSGSGLKIIASGGVASLDDIRRLKKLEKFGVTGVIIGKALYEGRFTLTEALKFA